MTCCVSSISILSAFVVDKMADRDTENSKRKRGGATSPRIPQLVPTQSTGGLLGCLKATIRFRFIAYILAQPPSCLFLLGLSLLAFSLWPLGVYVTYSTLPNLDVMLVSWVLDLALLRGPFAYTCILHTRACGCEQRDLNKLSACYSARV